MIIILKILNYKKKDNDEFNKCRDNNIELLIEELVEEESGCGFNILKWRKYLLVTVSETFGSGW